MTVTITPIFAGLLAMAYAYLAMRVIVARRTMKVGLGDGGEKTMLRHIRVHGNFGEYVPFVLMLMLMGELLGAPGWLTVFIGGLLVAGRLVHAVGVSQEPEITGSRTVGMALTFTALLVAGLVDMMLGLTGALS